MFFIDPMIPEEIHEYVRKLGREMAKNQLEQATDQIARVLFNAAIKEDRCGELLTCLWDGGSATVDYTTGKLLCVSAEQLSQLTVTAIDD